MAALRIYPPESHKPPTKTGWKYCPLKEWVTVTATTGEPLGYRCKTCGAACGPSPSVLNPIAAEGGRAYVAGYPRRTTYTHHRRKYWLAGWDAAKARALATTGKAQLTLKGTEDSK